MTPTSSHSGCIRAALRLLAMCCALLGSPLLHGQGPAARSASATMENSLTGLVEDSTGAIIPNALVALTLANGSVVANATTDSAGRFRLTLPGAADYQLTVTLEGFEPLVQSVHAGRSPLAPLTLKMNIANVATSVTVNADENVDVGAPENNHDAASVSASDMKSLPILDGDIVATLSAFLDSGATGDGGATLMVDGVEVKQTALAPSAIERISINQNPYSAQYRQPGRGQIEIVSKQTADKFHGSASFSFRDSIFDASNYFATSKPPDRRQNWEGFLTGPIRPHRLAPRDTTFLFSFQRQQQDSYAQVDATAAPAGESPTGNVLVPYRSTKLTMKVAHQISDHHSAYLLYSFFDSSRANNDVGGLTLASAGYSTSYFDMDLTFHDDDAITPNLLNQFTLFFERNIDGMASTTQAPQINVSGAFVAGGAQLDQLNTENNPNLTDIVSWGVGPHQKHQLKFGIQLPNMGRRILEDNTDRQGVYTFSSLAAYQSNSPNTFTFQQGQSRFLTYYLQPGAFFQDQIEVTDRLTITPGVRYDWQNTIGSTKDAIQPKLAVAYVLDKKHALVLRTGGGVYMRRVGVNIGQQLVRYEHAAEQSYLFTTGICYPPVAGCNTPSAQPPNLFNFAPNLKAPMQGYFGLSAERELTKGSTLTLGYEGYRGWHALRSDDVNAPLPPFTTSARPNPSLGQVLQLQSGGIQRSDALIASYRGRVTHVFSGFAQYTWQHADSDSEYSTFQPQNQYAPYGAEWARSNNDQRHRLALFGTFYPEKPVFLGVGFYANSPLPYTETTGSDDYKTGVLNARPAGVPRNSLNGGDYEDLQLRLGYTRRLQPKLKDASPTLAFSVSSFNTLNRVNFQDYVGVVTSPKFLQPTAAGSPRRMQFGVSFNF